MAPKNKRIKENFDMDQEIMDDFLATRDVVSSVPAVSPPPPVKQQSKPKMSFDAYFVLLMGKKPKIQEHHKLPMKRFLAQFGNVEAQTIDWFDEKIKKY